ELRPFESEAARHDLASRTLEDAQLRVAVALERPVAVEVIGLEIEQHGDLERELVDVLELERRQLTDDPRVLRRVHPAQRPTDVARDDRVASRGAKDRAQQLA